MNLHIEVSGSGRPLVMLHGWGMHGGVWGDAVDRLAQSFEVHVVDLPGHGQSPFEPEYFAREEGLGTNLHARRRERAVKLLDALTDQLSMIFHEPVMLCGWSLGGIVALHWAAREPEKIERLAIVSSTPCFAEQDGWLYGMPLTLLQQFAADLEVNYTSTLRRFIGLQVRGSDDERELLARLRQSLFSRGEPDLDALRIGLDILRDADLRAVLPHIEQPTLVIAGARDKLTPLEASRHMVQMMPDARLVEIRGAAHAPFLSHPDIFDEYVKRFLNGKI